MLVVTDGGDNLSRTKPKDLGASLSASGTRLFAVVVAAPLGYRQRRPEEVDLLADELRGLVEKSGGSVFGPVEQLSDRRIYYVASLAEKIPVSEALNRFYAGIFNNDLITIGTPSSGAAAGQWKLQFSSRGREKFKGSHLEYPTVVNACKAIEK
jgi:hypothetical protein